MGESIKGILNRAKINSGLAPAPGPAQSSIGVILQRAQLKALAQESPTLTPGNSSIGDILQRAKVKALGQEPAANVPAQSPRWPSVKAPDETEDEYNRREEARADSFRHDAMAGKATPQKSIFGPIVKDPNVPTTMREKSKHLGKVAAVTALEKVGDGIDYAANASRSGLVEAVPEDADNFFEAYGGALLRPDKVAWGALKALPPYLRTKTDEGELLDAYKLPNNLATRLAAGIATDPLTYLSFGTSTAAGRGAEILEQLVKNGDELKAVVRLASEASQAGKASRAQSNLLKAVNAIEKQAGAEAGAIGKGLLSPLPVAEGLGQQARLGQRALVNVGLPFTGLEAPLVRGAGALDQVDQLLKSLKTAKGAELLSTATESHLPQYGSEFGKRTDQLLSDVKAQRNADIYDLGELLDDVSKRRAELPGDNQAAINRALQNLIEVKGAAAPNTETEQLADFLRDQYKGMLTDAELSNIKLANAENDLLHYSPRILTPDARKALEVAKPKAPSNFPTLQKSAELLTGKPKPTLTDLMPGDEELAAALKGKSALRKPMPLSTRGTQNIARKEELRETPKIQINDLWELQHGHRLFNEDPLQDLAARSLKHIDSKTNARLAEGMLGNILETIPPEFLAKGPNKTHAARFLKDIGMTVPAGMDLSSKWIPNEVIDFVKTQHQFWRDPEKAHWALKAYDDVLNTMRGSVTAYAPSFHFRNLMSNIVLGAQGGNIGPRMIDHYGDALRFQLNQPITKTLANGRTMSREDLAREFFKHEITTRGVATEWGEDLLRAGDPQAILERVQGTTKRDLFSLGRDVGQTIENNARVALAFDLIDKGWTDFDKIAKHVKKTFFDYGDLTKFERNIARRLRFFYTFSRKNLPRQIEYALKHPGALSTLGRLDRLTSPSAEGLPDWSRDEYKFGGVAGFGLPQAEALTTAKSLNPTSMDSITPLAPGVKNALEIIFGKNSYKRMDISDDDRISKPMYNALDAWLTPSMKQDLGLKLETTAEGPKPRVHPYLSYLLQQPPHSRMVNEVERLLDKDTPPTERLLRMLTGLHPLDHDEAKQTRYRAINKAKKEAEQDLLRGDVKRVELLAPTDTADPEVKARIKRLNELFRKKRGK